MIIVHNQLTENDLSSKPFKEGSLYFTDDTKRIYMDPIGGNSRILVSGDPIILNTESERENLLAPIPGKIYFILESSNIYIYQEGTWHSYVETDSTLTIHGKAADAKAVGDALSNKSPLTHTHDASQITTGTFGGQVIANSSYQAPGTSLLRNCKLVSTESTPTVNGEINWVYE